MRFIPALTATALITVLITACTPEPEMPDRAEGKSVFIENCAVCHGATGQGDGPAATDMRPKPSDLTQLAARNKGVFDRAAVLSMIDGYTRPELAGGTMPEFGDFLDGDSVPVDTGGGVFTPTPRPLAAVMLYLETLQR